MKAILESFQWEWNIKKPYVTWKEDVNAVVEHRGKKLPKGKNIIPISQVPGKASVSVAIKFVVDDYSEDKKHYLIQKIEELNDEIKT